MRTLTFTPGPTVIREALTETTGVGMPGFMHLFDAAPRPRYKFNVQIGPLVKTEAESLSALHAFHQGDKTFFWDGGWYGTVPDYNLVGEGDGRRTEYFLPNNYIGHANSVAVRTLRPSTGATSVWATAAYTVWLAHGLIRTSTAPASGDQLQSKYSCFYRVGFDPAGLRLDQIATDLYVAQFDLIEKLGFVDWSGVAGTALYQVSLDAAARLMANESLSVPMRRLSLAAFTQLAANVTTAMTSGTPVGAAQAYISIRPLGSHRLSGFTLVPPPEPALQRVAPWPYGFHQLSGFTGDFGDNVTVTDTAGGLIFSTDTMQIVAPE